MGDEILCIPVRSGDQAAVFFSRALPGEKPTCEIQETETHLQTGAGGFRCQLRIGGLCLAPGED